MSLPAPTCDYEAERLKRIEENRRKLADMGLLRQKSILESFRAVKPNSCMFKPAFPKPERKYVKSRPAVVRRSKRLQGSEADYVEIDEHDNAIEYDDPLVDLMDRKGYSRGELIVPEAPTQEELQIIQQRRCASQGRGSVYDSAVGITCHFCRQKKLCGEPDCTRCQNRDASADCIGKTDCSRCHSAFGRFCRACLLIRYGLELEEVRAQLEAGTWLCPHCYEEEHPDHGWICNSSICMKRRGLKPTGIAIYEAQERGFKSVAHLLQDQIQKRGGVNKLSQVDLDAEVRNSGADDAATAQAGPSSSPGAAEAGPSTSQAAEEAGPGRRSRRATRKAAADATQAQEAPASTRGAAEQAGPPEASGTTGRATRAGSRRSEPQQEGLGVASGGVKKTPGRKGGKPALKAAAAQEAKEDQEAVAGGNRRSQRTRSKAA
mmetsp:Transcript_16304/g.35256  ORF Transcript_16304/g.35256 Transcript_16304/m.35256 type:complete len:434 (-) Transcript_16304:782-2083(-)